MPLTPGTMLGPYEILNLIGAGGMGEVYKAHDPRLNRIVAIKTLPAHLAERAELRERFKREAETVANLKHPNICVLYDIGYQPLRAEDLASASDVAPASRRPVEPRPQPGPSEGVHYLVMEYLEGETLAQRLLKGSLPLDQVLRYAIEISDALDKAHRSGATHRDIKPGNIMLTKEGSKLLDFGLAKLKQEAAQPNIPLSQLPTGQGPLTQDGMLLGTLQYMAPEQVEGKVDEIDARTDIFAFGAVVYEMATGKKCFEGQTAASTIAKILEHDPPSMSSLQPMMPPLLDTVVKRCLAKDPDQRWQSANDLTFPMRLIAQGGSQATLPAPVVARRKTRERVLAGIAALAILIAAALAVLYLTRTPAAKPQVMRFTIGTPGNSSPRISPDGRQLAFIAPDSSGKSIIWIRTTDSLTARPLPGAENAVGAGLFWSPDNRSLGFTTADGRLKKVEVSSGAVQILASGAGHLGGAWSRDGFILFPPEEYGGLVSIPETGGELTTVTTLNASRKEVSHRFPEFLPDGRHFIYLVKSAQAENNGIYVGSLDSKESQLLVNTPVRGRYAPIQEHSAPEGATGYLLFVREQTLMAQPFDAERLALTGQPLFVAEQVDVGAAVGNAFFSVSDTGVLAYTRAASAGSQLVWFDRTGNPLGTLGPPVQHATNPSPELSPDGKRVSVTREVAGGNTDVWVLDTAGGAASRFTFDAARENSPLWSPDGGRILFRSNRGGAIYNFYQKSSSGAGNEEAAFQSDDTKFPLDWSADGRFILYQVSGKSGTGLDLWVLPLADERKPFAFLQTPASEGQGQFSPNGRWVAYVSNESGEREVYIQSFPTPGSKRQVSTSGGDQPRWRADGKELFYVASDRKLMAVSVERETSVEVGPPTALFQTKIERPAMGPAVKPNYDVTADGKRFILLLPSQQSDSPITLVLNWPAALKQ